MHRALLAADLLGLASAYVVAQVSGRAEWPPGRELVAFGLLVPFWGVVAKLFGFYGADEQRIDHSTLDETISVFLLDTVAIWFVFVVAHLARPKSDFDRKLLVFWAVAAVAVIAGRSASRALLRRRPAFRQRALILGNGQVGQLIARKLRQHPGYGVDALGYVVDGDVEINSNGLPVLGGTRDLSDLVRRLGVERVFVALPQAERNDALPEIRALAKLDVYVDLVPDPTGIIGPNGVIHSLEGLPLLDLPPVRLSRSSRLLKRGIDVAGALAGLALAAPLFLVIPVVIRRGSPGPAFFRQTRLGEGMREFTFLKFRTMRADAGEERHREYIRATMDTAAEPLDNGLYKLDRGDEVTRIGAFLRRTSLDELPQLLNVLRGDMSLVGPRPCIPYETQYFEPHHFERFLVPAGLTGLWQVTARAHSTFGEALDMDVAYARGRSLALDVTLILRTFRHLFTHGGTA